MKNISGKITKYLVNIIVLNHICIKVEIRWETWKCWKWMHISEYEWDTTTAAFTGKFTALLKAYTVRKIVRPQVSDLTFHLQKLKKEREQIKPKGSKRNELVNYSHSWNRKINNKGNGESKSWLSENVSQTDWPLARWIKKENRRCSNKKKIAKIAEMREGQWLQTELLCILLHNLYSVLLSVSLAAMAQLLCS